MHVHLLFSHLVPVNPAGQVHMNPFCVLVQVPLIQGFVKQEAEIIRFIKKLQLIKLETGYAIDYYI